MAYSLNTNTITAITSTTATSGGNTIVGSGTVAFRGVCWNTTGNPTIADSTNSLAGNSTANYSLNLTSLSAGSTYYVRAYIIDSLSNVYYGNQWSFTTPSLVTTAASSITSTTAISGGTFTGIVGTISAVGVCWDISTNPDPDINDSKTTDVSVGGTFTSIISGLLPNTTYKIRCYVQTITGVSYGDVKTFTTTATTPTVITSPTISSITSTSFVAGGNVTADGGSSVTSRGIQRSLSIDMTSPTNTTMGSGTGAFTGTISGLTAGTTYYLRAFATNAIGTVYGEIISVATLGGPTVVTIPPYSITSSTAVTGCDVVSDGGTAITARGVCWSSTQTLPTTSNSTVVNDPNYAQTSPFITELSGLVKDTTYYVRAFATNSVSTLYGDVEIFSTSPCNPYVEDCNPQDPVVECDSEGCAYYIPAECAIYTEDSNILCEGDSFITNSSATQLINSFSIIGSIADDVLTVTAVEFGTLSVGTVLNAVEITEGTYIVAQLTGTPGGIGTYQVSVSQTVTSRRIESGRFSTVEILENINSSLCTVFSKQYMIDMLNTIKNTQYLNVQFCVTACPCGPCGT